MEPFRLFASSKKMAEQLRLDNGAVEVIITQKLPTTRKPIRLTGERLTLRKLAPREGRKGN